MLYDQPILKLPKKEDLSSFHDYATPTDLVLMMGDFEKMDTIGYWLENAKNSLLETYAVDQPLGIRPLCSYKPSMEEQKEGLVYYGSYPQWAVSKSLNEDLTFLLEHHALRDMRKKYTFFPNVHSVYDYPAYSYGGRQYVAIPSNKKVRLSNGQLVNQGDTYFLEVSPITWYILENRPYIVSKHILCAMPNKLSTKSLVSLLDLYLENEMPEDLFSRPVIEDKKEDQFTYLKERLKLMRISYPELESTVANLLETVTFIEDTYHRDRQKEIEELKQRIKETEEKDATIFSYIDDELANYIHIMDQNHYRLKRSQVETMQTNLKEVKEVVKKYIKEG